MKLRSLTYFNVLIILSFSACKSAYEQVRTSNDPAKILATADQYFAEGDHVKAQSLYEQVIPFYRGKKEAEDLFYNYTYTYYNQQQYLLASHYFKNFTQTFFNSDKKEEMAFMSAYSNYEMSPNYKLDQTPSIQAIEELQSFINQYPSSPRVEESNKLMDELRAKMELKSYEQGKLYYNLKNFQSAMSSFENTLKDFPETTRAEEIRLLIVRSSEELARNSVYEKMQERLDSAIEKCNAFLKRYPDTRHKKEINSIIAYANNELKRFNNE